MPIDVPGTYRLRIESGGEVLAAVLMSLYASAKRHALNPWVYLTDVLTQLAAKPFDVTHLLPDAWAKRPLVAGR